MPRPRCAPATKADIDAVKTDLKKEIAAVRTDLTKEITAVRTDLTADIAAVKTELKTDILDLRVELRGEIHASAARLALGLDKTNARMDRLDADLRGEMRQMRSDVAGIMDTAVSRMETLWRESLALPKLIDDHERRLRVLEGRPPL